MQRFWSRVSLLDRRTGSLPVSSSSGLANALSNDILEYLAIPVVRIPTSPVSVEGNARFAPA